MKYTDYIGLTNDDLLTMAYTKDNPASLEVELAQRLETAESEIDSLLRGDVGLEAILSEAESNPSCTVIRVATN